MNIEMKGPDDPRREPKQIPIATPAMLRGRLWLALEDALFQMGRNGVDARQLVAAAGARCYRCTR